MQAGGSLKLGETLRLHTRQLHTRVERSPLMQALLRGRIDRHTYCSLLRNLHAIYEALEAALENHASHPGIAPVWHDGLARSRLLTDDLAFLHGPDWSTAHPLAPAGAAYVRRLRQCDAAAPDLLLAHAYVRYLGDLSGGQTLRRLIAGRFGLDGATGTRFYAFGETAAEVAALARRFRDGLDAVHADSASTDALVAEAQWGFAQHERLFTDLEAGLVKGATFAG